jgi:DNA primase
MMEKEEIERVKQGVDLVALIRSKGIELKRAGRSYRGLCPFHSESEPSFTVNPSKKLWQCFGCGAAGDAIRFVELFDKVGFRDAVVKLGGKSLLSGHPAQGEAAKKESSVIDPGAQAAKDSGGALSVRRIKLLSRVIEFYHTAFAEDAIAMDYLARRGITDKGLFSSYKIGFSNGTLLNVLPNEGDITSELKELGILNERGFEHFFGCITFPLFDSAGNPVSIYGRRCECLDGTDGPAHLYLPGERRGIFNYQAARASSEIILTEAVIDSLTLIQFGIRNTIACYGVNGFSAGHMNLLKDCGVKTVYICFDSDEPGRSAALALAERLRSEGLDVHSVSLPAGEDINSFFSLTANAGDHFKRLMRGETPRPAKIASDSGETRPGEGTQKAVKEKSFFEQTEFGLRAAFGGRSYEVRGIAANGQKLKATVKGIAGEGASKRFFVDTVDFYSARSRGFLVKGLSDLFSEPQDVVLKDLDRIMEQVEKHREREDKTAEPAQMSEKERDEALSFLKNPDLFSEILDDFETLGYTGEETNKLLCYIAAVSRKMDEPLSVMIQSRSAAGKSFLQDTVLSLVPEDETIKYTRLTDQALFYKEPGSLRHKILAIEELDGMGGAIYSIRSIQSSKKITIAYTGKDPVSGKLKTEENTVEGPLMIFITTTADEIDGETASRFVFLSIDESAEMTEKILKKQRERHTIAGMLGGLKAERIRAKHKNANRLLRPVRIVNPYAGLLTFPSKSLRARRDHTKYLNLILAVACLFQYQRKHKSLEHEKESIDYIEVTLSDIEKANAIAGEILGRSLDELAPPSRRLLGLIREMVLLKSKKKDTAPESFRFTRRDIRHFSGWSDYQVKTHIKQLEDLEYIYPQAGKKGKEYVYELLATCDIPDDKPFLIGLTGMDELAKRAFDAGISG